MSCDSLLVPDIRRSCSTLFGYSDILGCDAASTVKIYRLFGGVAITVLSVGPRGVSDWLVRSFQNGGGTCFICRI